MAANKTFTELDTLATVDKANDWLAVVDVSDTTASTYGTTKKANVDQFIGPTGAAATVDAGTTTTGAAGTDASVVNAGTTSAAVFNFTIPRGNTGATGAAGSDGADGDSAYVYIAYASDASGADFTTTFSATLDYIAIKTTTTEITTPQASDFTGLWKNYKGAQGIQGIQGETGLTGEAGADGTDGANAYVYIAYASDSSGTGFTTTFDTNLDYVAIKATTTEILTPQASDFTGLWKNYKGATGAQGLQGVPGVDGTDGLDINWLGVYDAGTGYVINDAVFYEGSSYICIAPSTGNLPTDTTYWDLMAQQGAAGSGSGDVSGPSSATDNAIARFDLATGKLIQDSSATITDDGSVNIPSGQNYLIDGTPVGGAVDSVNTKTGTVVLDPDDLDDTTTINKFTNATDISKLAGIDDNANNYSHPNHSGDVTSVGDGATTIANSAVTNAKMADMATKTYKGRTSATTGVPEDVAVATLKTDLGLVKGDVGLGNVDNTSDATKNSATVTLTNKTIDGDTNTISNLAHGAEVDNPTSGVHGVTGSVVGTTDTQTLSAKTLTSPVINTGVSGTAVLDEDNMASDSATKLATQQSIKAYVDAQGFTWKGEWATSTAYALNDTVESGGSGYVCISAHTSGASTQPGVGASWATVWGRFVEGNTKTMPTGDVVGTTDTQTLTNKTLTAPALTSPTMSGTWDGWISAGETWTYASADDPTFTFTVGADVTTKYSVGMKIKLTQGTVKYFIITAISAFTGGNTTITVYGGTDYDLASSAISANAYSMMRTPVGFPMSPTKWRGTSTKTADSGQSNPTANTWYNIQSFNIVVPIGVWRVGYSVPVIVARSTAGEATEFSTLSTANNSESDENWTVRTYGRELMDLENRHNKERILELTSKTTLYLNAKTSSSGIYILSVYASSLSGKTAELYYECAYL